MNKRAPHLLAAVATVYALLYVAVCALLLMGSGESREIGQILRFAALMFWVVHSAFLYEQYHAVIPMWTSAMVVTALGVCLAIAIWKLKGWPRIAATVLLLFGWMLHGLHLFSSST